MSSIVNYTSSFADKFYRLFGLDAETAPGLWVAAGGIFLTMAIIILTRGQVAIAVAAIAVLSLIALTLYRLDYSFMLLVGCVLLFDQFNVPGFSPYTFR